MRYFVAPFAVVTLSAMAWAQTPGNTPQGANPQSPNPQSTQTQSATPSTSAAQGQSWTGVLMDANCSAIKSSQVSSYSAGGASATAPTSGTSVTQSGTTTGAQAGTTADLSSTRVTDRASQAGTTPRSTASAAERNEPETGIAERNTPTTAATPRTDPQDITSGPLRTPTAPGTSAAAAEGVRARAGETMIPTTVREKYKDCKVSSGTTAFAIHADGKLILLDDASNQMVRNKVSSDTALNTRINNSEWMSVTLNGSMEGDQLKVNSISGQ